MSNKKTKSIRQKCYLYLQMILRKRKYFYRNILILSILFTSLYYLFTSGFLCSNIQVWNRVHKVCESYKNGDSVGNLCSALCDTNKIHNYQCERSSSNAFSAILEGVRLYFQTSPRIYQTNEISELKLLEHLANNEYNLSSVKIDKLSHLSPVEIRNELRHVELDNLYNLLQNKNYFLSRIYNDYELQPTIIGSCGLIYAHEYSQPIEFDHFWDDSDGMTWLDRLHIATLLYEFIERLEQITEPKLLLCDVKLADFGFSFDKTKVYFLNQLYTDTEISLKLEIQSCFNHNDCKFYSCQSECINHVCSTDITNNNIQIICENVFLGHKWGGILIPGLLSIANASPALTSLLRLCAFPHGEEGGIKFATPDDIRERLQGTIEEMYNDLSSS